jgi:hypothetical protein
VPGIILEDALERTRRFVPATRAGVCLTQVQSRGRISGIQQKNALELLYGRAMLALVEQCRAETHAHRRRRPGKRQRFSQHALRRRIVSGHEMGEAEAFESGTAVRSDSDSVLEQRHRKIDAAFHEPSGAEQPQGIGVARRALENFLAEPRRGRYVSTGERLMRLFELALDGG